MRKTKLKSLEKLSSVYNEALCVCDPLEYQQRQKRLLYAIAHVLLEELEDFKLTTLEESQSAS